MRGLLRNRGPRDQSAIATMGTGDVSRAVAREMMPALNAVLPGIGLGQHREMGPSGPSADGPA